MNEHDLLHPPVREPDITVRRFIAIVVAAILFCFSVPVIGTYIALHTFDCAECEKKTFDSEIWKHAPLQKPYPRVQMVDDLLLNYRLVGMTPELVEALLGPASTVDSTGECGYFTVLGAELSMFPIDPIFLCLRFEEGQVVDARIVEF